MPKFFSGKILLLSLLAVATFVVLAIRATPYPLVDCLLSPLTTRNSSDKEAAIFVKACEGNAVAQIAIGLMYFSGEYVDDGQVKPSNFDINNRTAVRWLRTAADKGSANAKYYIALVIKLSEEINAVDGKEYLIWLSDASINGSVMAERVLGQSYLSGVPEFKIPKDVERGLMLLKRAAEKGDEPAARELQSRTK